MVSAIVQQGARIGLPTVMKLAQNKMVQQGLAGLGVVESYDIISGLFNKDEGGELGNTDPQTADEYIKLATALMEEMDATGIPLTGLKNSQGEPLQTNYIVIDIQKGRVFPIHKYRSKKTVSSARKRGSSRGWRSAYRTASSRKYLYK